MVEKKIGNYEVPARDLAATEPKTSEPTYAEHYWNFDRKPEHEEMSRDPDGYAFKEFVKAIEKDAQARRQ